MTDAEVLKLVKKNPNMLVPWFLMAAYAYYELDDSLISDSTYDEITKMIIQKWFMIDHYHADLLDLDSLKAGTYLGEYPEITKDTAVRLLNGHN